MKKKNPIIFKTPWLHLQRDGGYWYRGSCYLCESDLSRAFFLGGQTPRRIRLLARRKKARGYLPVIIWRSNSSVFWIREPFHGSLLWKTTNSILLSKVGSEMSLYDHHRFYVRFLTK